MKRAQQRYSVRQARATVPQSAEPAEGEADNVADRGATQLHGGRFGAPSAGALEPSLPAPPIAAKLAPGTVSLAKKGDSAPGEKRSAGPQSPPPVLPAFPGAQRGKPKTPVQGGGKLRARWEDSDGNILEWDYQHGTVEKYSKRGKHLGEFDPSTGAQLKPADPTRKIDP